MKTLGIIAEYNPFHNGHKYHIEKSKEITGAEAVIAIMSGNFVQRGELALLPKNYRTKMALLSGVDLVIELPAIFACNNSEQFAKGGIKILDSLGIVDYLSFGAENENLDFLKRAASVYAWQPMDYLNLLRDNLDNKLPFPKARSMALASYLGLSNYEEKMLETSNNILAIEYLKQLELLGSKIEPVAIKREGSAYNDTHLGDGFASASAIREALKGTSWVGDKDNLKEKSTDASCDADFSIFSPYLPQGSVEVIGGFYNGFDGNVHKILNDRKCKTYDLFRYKVICSSEEELSEIYAAGEGLTNRIKAKIRYANSFEELTEMVISKRYTRARLNRLYMQILLGIKKQDYEELTKFRNLRDYQCDYQFERQDGAINSESPKKNDANMPEIYARVLGFSAKGAKLLRKMKKNDTSSIPIITNINKEKEALSTNLKKMLEYDILASDIYNLVTYSDYSFRTLTKDNCELYQNSDFVTQPIVI